MNGYTSIEQSTKLLELGLDPETADMYYPNRVDIKGNYAFPKEAKHGNPLISQEIPCWSLAALLDLIPSYIDPPEGSELFFLDMWKYRSKYWLVSYRNNVSKEVYIDASARECIDAVFTMTYWLLSKKYIKPIKNN